MKTARKPIFPVLPSVVNVKDEIDYFISLGNIYFPDEVLFGKALCQVYNTPIPAFHEITLTKVDTSAIRSIIDNAPDGYLSPEKVQALFDAAGIHRAGEAIVVTAKAAVEAANRLGFPVVMKVVGPLHKSDVGGVVLNVNDVETVRNEFERMISIKETTAILLQPMLTGQYAYVGAKFEPKFGHLVLCGLGGIYIEVLKDVQVRLSPISLDEAHEMIQGVRGQEGINEDIYAEVITRVAALCKAAPEIMEMDVNPLIGNMHKLTAVDARIRIEKNNKNLV
jgi:acetyltransferase